MFVVGRAERHRRRLKVLMCLEVDNLSIADKMRFI